ncbi:MAG: hypothetical protein Q8Q04_01530 [archaeon]|nr:hypothetical protein [archaeon]
MRMESFVKNPIIKWGSRLLAAGILLSPIKEIHAEGKDGEPNNHLSLNESLAFKPNFKDYFLAKDSVKKTDFPYVNFNKKSEEDSKESQKIPENKKISLADKLIMDGLSLTHSVVSGYSAYYQMRDRTFFRSGDEELEKKYNSLWHTTQGIELGLSLGSGGYSVLKNKDEFLEYTKDLAMFSALRWVFRDGVYNSLNENPFFYKSPHTTAKLEPLGNWYVKLAFLGGAILYKYWDEIFD